MLSNSLPRDADASRWYASFSRPPVSEYAPCSLCCGWNMHEEIERRNDSDGECCNCARTQHANTRTDSARAVCERICDCVVLLVAECRIATPSAALCCSSCARALRAPVVGWGAGGK
eukprot:417612-Rhodomonas_salina.1